MLCVRNNTALPLKQTVANKEAIQKWVKIFRFKTIIISVLVLFAIFFVPINLQVLVNPVSLTIVLLVKSLVFIIIWCKSFLPMLFAKEPLLGRILFVPCFVWAYLALSLPSTFQTRLIMLFAFFACLFSLIHLSSILNHVLWYFLHRKSSFQTIPHFWVIPAKSYFQSTLNSLARTYVAQTR